MTTKLNPQDRTKQAACFSCPFLTGLKCEFCFESAWEKRSLKDGVELKGVKGDEEGEMSGRVLNSGTG